MLLAIRFRDAFIALRRQPDFILLRRRFTAFFPDDFISPPLSMLAICLRHSICQLAAGTTPRFMPCRHFR